MYKFQFRQIQMDGWMDGWMDGQKHARTPKCHCDNYHLLTGSDLNKNVPTCRRNWQYLPQTSHPRSDKYVPQTASFLTSQMWNLLTTMEMTPRYH